MLGYKIIKIEGHSMEPAVKAGSFALIKLRPKKLKPGDIIMFQAPGQAMMVKRIAEVKENGYYVLGDNKDDSTDSRAFGTVPRSSVAGKLIWF